MDSFIWDEGWYYVIAAFQTAVTLAEYGNERDEEGKILVKDSHIMQIVGMSEEFKAYLKTLHLGDESKRAERQRIRLDEYDPNAPEYGHGGRRGKRWRIHKSCAGITMVWRVYEEFGKLCKRLKVRREIPQLWRLAGNSMHYPV